MATAGKILMYPVGNWTSGNNYGFLDIVYYGGSSYIAKTDITNSTVNPETDTTNWQILARGYLADTLSGIDGIDTSGLLGTAGATVASQTLIDKIADMVADKLVLKTAISNQQVNDTTKVTGSALSYSMNETLTTLNSNLTNLTTAVKHNITDASTTLTGSNHTVNLYIRNSICYCSISMTTSAIGNGFTVRSDMPKPNTGVFEALKTAEGTPLGLIYIDANTNILKINSSAAGSGFCAFSYPIVPA